MNKQEADEHKASPMNQFLEDAAFPTDRGTLINHARGRQAPQELITRLENLPDGQFNNILEINRFAGLSGQTGGGDPEPWKAAITGTLPKDQVHPLDSDVKNQNLSDQE